MKNILNLIDIRRNLTTGLIYKYTNLLNGKVYIGQTITSLRKRDIKHINDKNNTYFDRALKKYGRENFSLEVIEDDVPIEELDDREKYWIKYYDSHFASGKGYNMTSGGKWGCGNQILSPNQADEIKQLIKESSMTFKEIADKYGVSIYCVSDINNGDSFIDKGIVYPIRPAPKRSDINEDNLRVIIDLLANSSKTINEIADEVGVNAYTVGYINRGECSKCPTGLSYPIRKPIKDCTWQNKVNEEQVVSIVKDLIFSSITLGEIGQRYGISKNAVGDISRGLTWKEITHQFKCPIRINQLENQKIYSSIYCIV